MLKIITVPDPILRQKAKEVVKIDETIKNLIRQMRETLEKNPRQGVGLAAPQIGQSFRLILAKDGREEKATTYVLINPEILSSSNEEENGYEGCLSIPDSYCLVSRAKKISLRALNANGKKIKIKATDLFARVLQHEIDHLDGILITDKALGRSLTEKEYNQLIGAAATA